MTAGRTAARGESWFRGLLGRGRGSRAVLRGYGCLANRNSRPSGWLSTLPERAVDIYSSMTLKSAALFALVGMILLTVLVGAGFLRDLVSLASGAIAPVAVLTSGIHFLASLGVTVFFYVFHRAHA